MGSPYLASAAPVREAGVHSRAGNAMARTRAAVLDGASRAVEKHGARKATMADIASLAGIAKGTLYNHFRDKEAVYAAAIEGGIRTLAAECGLAAREDLAEAPATLAVLVTPNDHPLWRLARSSVRDVLIGSGAATSTASIDAVLRWLVSFVAAPGADATAQASMIAAGVTSGPA
jgi:AcrR family transcriptional regulator